MPQHDVISRVIQVAESKIGPFADRDFQVRHLRYDAGYEIQAADGRIAVVRPVELRSAA